MATEYLVKLSQLVAELEIEDAVGCPIQIKHFFSGAALYADGTICASWSPMGLAFKLPEPEVAALIAAGKAKPLQYFAKGHVKQGYALFEDPDVEKADLWRTYFIAAAQAATFV